MGPRTPAQLRWGAAACWPWVAILLFIPYAIVNTYHSTIPHRYALGLAFVTVCDQYVVLICFIRHLLRTDRIKDGNKGVWAVLLLGLTWVILPVYWYLYVRPDSTPSDG